MRIRCIRVWTLICVLWCMALFSFSAVGGAPEEGIEFFEKSIRPVLVQHCYECHSAAAAAEGKQQAGLLLDTKQGVLAGGESGAGIVPGDPSKSLLISALKYQSLEMPPNGRLPVEVIDNFEKWVKMGAPDPRVSTAAPTPRRAEFQITADDRQHWAYQPLSTTPPPRTTSDWVRGDIDRFVLAGQISAGFLPSAAIDRNTLLRRTSFAITGLPPTPDEITAFLTDASPGAFERVVDRLLDTPEFGVHWGRHWLDGVRYANNIDKSGEYRRWVVRALNSDLPYDQFVKLQIAGDLIPADSTVPIDRVHSSGASFDGITATGMMALAAWEQVGRDLAVAEIVDSQIDLVGRHLLGLTLACARCHDHKFDPVSTQDYYALAGILFSSHIATGKLIADDRLSIDSLVEAPLLNREQHAANLQLDFEISKVEGQIAAVAKKIPQASRLAELAMQIADLDKELAQTTTSAGKKSLTDQAAKSKAEQEKLLADQKKQAWDLNPPELSEIKASRSNIAELRKQKIIAPIAVAISEGGVPGSNREKIGDAPIYVRGEYQREGAIAPRRFPTILAGESQVPLGERTTQSGRRELAEWIASAENPLTARVMVNRIWQHMIGRPLVRSPDNFGRLGEKPTHPELLDYLARQFIGSGWSVKSLIREIALSAAFQQSSYVAPEVARIDPENRALSHMNRRRLTYEELRDSLLLLGSYSAQYAEAGTRTVKNAIPHRTMFDAIDRKKPDLTATIFDGPDPRTIVPVRAETTTAQQALYLMNNQFTVNTAKNLSARLANDPLMSTDRQRLDRLWILSLGRTPDATEVQASLEFLAEYDFERLVQAVLGTNEFVYLD